MPDYLTQWDALQERNRAAQRELERVRVAKSAVVLALLADNMTPAEVARLLRCHEKTVLRLAGLEERRSVRRRGGFGAA